MYQRPNRRSAVASRATACRMPKTGDPSVLRPSNQGKDMHRIAPAVLVCGLWACSSGNVNGPPTPYLEVAVTSIDPGTRRVIASVRNISGESLLIQTCIADLQRRSGDVWQLQETGRMCPEVFETLAPEATRTLELTLPADAPSCEYRLVASAATAQPRESESAVLRERTKDSESPVFCLSS